MIDSGRSAVAACAALLASGIVGASGGCTVGSGSGYANGPVWVTGCTGPTPKGDLLESDFHLDPTFFAGDPVEANTQPPTNFIGIRMQRNGSAIQYNDVLTFNIQNSYEVARCIRGRVDPVTGPDWDQVGLNLGPWCDWTGAGFPGDGGTSDGGAASDGGATTGGTPGRPRIRVTSQGYVQASVALLATCPINLLQTSGPALDGHSLDGWIEFTAFGTAAAEADQAPTARQPILPDFKVNFGDQLHATFHIQFEDHRVLTAMETQPTGPIPTPRMSATLDGAFDFTLLRARSAQPFP